MKGEIQGLDINIITEDRETHKEDKSGTEMDRSGEYGEAGQKPRAPVTFSDSQIFRDPLVLQIYNRYQMKKGNIQDPKFA